MHQSKDDSISLNLIKSTEPTILRNMHLITWPFTTWTLLRLSTGVPGFTITGVGLYCMVAWNQIAWVVCRYSCMNMDERSAIMYARRLCELLQKCTWDIETLFCSVSFSGGPSILRSFADLSCDGLDFRIFLVADPYAEYFVSQFYTA